MNLDNATVYYELLGTHRKGALEYTPLPIADALGRFTNLLQVPFDNPHIPEDAIPVIRAAVGPMRLNSRCGGARWTWATAISGTTAKP